ncbi:MAG: hypothetical protein K2J84_04580 [Bacteroidaceae bacterium]|nr:hypothetical protein [Bacteroidaceae bacterium]
MTRKQARYLADGFVVISVIIGIIGMILGIIINSKIGFVLSAFGGCALVPSIIVGLFYDEPLYPDDK